MRKLSAAMCSMLLFCSMSANADVQTSTGDDHVVIEDNIRLKGDSALNLKEQSLFKDTAWHKNIWQNSPAIIEITEAYINLLFNRPEIVFGLRRGIRFDWQDEHEYSDGKVVTTYRLRRTAEGRAQIDYLSVLVDAPKQTASGSFEIESRP